MSSVDWLTLQQEGCHHKFLVPWSLRQDVKLLWQKKEAVKSTHLTVCSTPQLQVVMKSKLSEWMLVCAHMCVRIFLQCKRIPQLLPASCTNKSTHSDCTRPLVKSSNHNKITKQTKKEKNRKEKRNCLNEWQLWWNSQQMKFWKPEDMAATWVSKQAKPSKQDINTSNFSKTSSQKVLQMQLAEWCSESCNSTLGAHKATWNEVTIDNSIDSDTHLATLWLGPDRGSSMRLHHLTEC